MGRNNRGGSDNDQRRPTKAERREDARRQREEIQRRMARRRRNRSLGLVLMVVAVAIAVVAVFLTSGGDDGTSAIPSGAELLQQASAAESAAGCEPVQTVSFYNGVTDTSSPDYTDQSHIGATGAFPAPPDLSTYPSTPPASGPHDPTPLPAGVYDSPPSVYQSIHSLEHGGAIVWYAPGISSQALDDLVAFYDQSADQANVGQDRVIVAPYDYSNQGTAGELPSGVQMTLVAWHHLQTCTQVSLAAAFDFTSQYGFYSPPLLDRPYKGEAPEAGGAM